jgi:hypothetical protein
VSDLNFVNVVITIVAIYEDQKWFWFENGSYMNESCHCNSLIQGQVMRVWWIIKRNKVKLGHTFSMIVFHVHSLKHTVC